MQAAGLALRLRSNRSALAVARSALAQRSALATRPAVRTVTLKSTPAEQAINVLNAQRLKRPSSPHFTIYQWQITWIPSIVNRMTGGALSALLYGFSLAYLLGPVVGIPVDTAHVVELVQGLPEWAKISGKTLLAAPFAFHALNGVRHLAWDSTKLMALRQITRSGYIVIGLSAVSTVALVLM